MKKVIFLLFIALSAVFFSFRFGGDKKHKHIVGPPGTVWLNDSIYMDVKEVTNAQYREYIYWLRAKYEKDEPLIIKKELPDTLVWRKFGGYNEDLVTEYFSHPEYADYPVVGVSFQQARDYCKWRSDRTKELIGSNTKEKKPVIPPEIIDLYFRLPSIKEWERAAFAGLDTAYYPYGYYGLSDTVHDVKVNVKKSYSAVVGMSYSANPLRVDLNIPNEYGFYNMIGNVAEMCSEEGLSKGGSWKDYLDVCHIKDAIEYEEASNWLGFRCVCVVKYKPGYMPPKNK